MAAPERRLGEHHGWTQASRPELSAEEQRESDSQAGRCEHRATTASSSKTTDCHTSLMMERLTIAAQALDRTGKPSSPQRRPLLREALRARGRR